MKGSALAFSFVALIAILVFALTLISATIGVLVDIIPASSIAIFLPVLVIVIFFNLSIVYGLRREKIWAIYLGAIEICVLIVVMLLGAFDDGVSSLMSVVSFLLVMGLILLALWQDYNKFKVNEVTHV